MSKESPSRERRRREEAELESVAVLAEPVRRRIFLELQRAGAGLTRRAIAQALSIPDELARFHLDRLEREGLVASAPPSARSKSGRGGRPAKVYSIVGPISVSIPPRRHALAGRILARALARSSGAASAVALAAREAGAEMAQQVETETVIKKNGAGDQAVRRRSDTKLESLLEDLGFQPFEDEHGVIRLGNCAFHELVEENPPLICGLNLEFLGGLCAGAGISNRKVVLDPRSGHCCVAFVPSP